MTRRHNSCARRAKQAWEPGGGGTAEGPWKLRPAGPFPAHAPLWSQERLGPIQWMSFPSPSSPSPVHPQLTTDGVLTPVAGGTLGTRMPLLVGLLPLHIPSVGGEENAGGPWQTLTLPLIHTPSSKGPLALTCPQLTCWANGRRFPSVTSQPP